MFVIQPLGVIGRSSMKVGTSHRAQSFGVFRIHDFFCREARSGPEGSEPPKEASTCLWWSTMLVGTLQCRYHHPAFRTTSVINLPHFLTRMLDLKERLSSAGLVLIE